MRNDRWSKRSISAWMVHIMDYSESVWAALSKIKNIKRKRLLHADFRHLNVNHIRIAGAHSNDDNDNFKSFSFCPIVLRNIRSRKQLELSNLLKWLALNVARVQMLGLDSAWVSCESNWLQIVLHYVCERRKKRESTTKEMNKTIICWCCATE